MKTAIVYYSKHHSNTKKCLMHFAMAMTLPQQIQQKQPIPT